jgi:hypothetical protein
MTSPAPDDAPPGPPFDHEVGVLEVGALLAILLVATTATWSLALAQLSMHDGWAACGLGLVTAALTAAPVLTRRRRPTVRVDRTELLLGAATIAAALVMFLPGDPYAYGDKDPGVYVSHAFAIAREGDVVIPDRVLERVDDPELFSDGARYPGFWVEPEAPTSVTPQFFHLYPATAATAIDVLGPSGAWTLNPLLAALSTLAVVLAVRRTAGTLPAALSGLLLVVSMPQVWQAKYTSTEILSQLLLAGAVFGAVVSLRTRWVGGVALAGAAIGTGFLARPDGILYVLLGVALACALFALRWSDERVRWFLGGLLVTIPYALWNAFGLREGYTLGNTVPRLSVLVAAVLGMAMVAVLIRRLRPPRPAAFVRPGAQRWAGPALVVLSAAILLLAWFREDLLGIDYTYFGTRKIRSYDELNLVWLSWFFGVKGLVAMWLGICVVLLHRWRAALLLLVGPGLVLLPVYLYEAKISPRLMWWVRRFIPGIIPSMIVLIALFLAWAIYQRRWSVRIAGIAFAAVLAVESVQQSWPLRAHREFGGSYDFGKDLASTVPGPDDGVLLFAWPAGGLFDPNRNLPGPVWFIHDRTTALLPLEPTTEDVSVYADAFPGEPIFVMTSQPTLPAGLDEALFRRSDSHRVLLPVWEESVFERPDESVTVDSTIVVWEFLG